jgi:hypothetical protein
MKKYVIFVCLITLWGCSKNEDILLNPDNSIEVSHITNDDLALVDGFIELIISKEDAIERGVPASEYDLVEETLARHNNSRVQTKSVNSTIAWGILQYPADFFNSDVNLYSLLPLPGGVGGSLTLYYSMGMSTGSGDNCEHTLEYTLSGWVLDDHAYFHDIVLEYSSGEGTIPFPYLYEASMRLNYSNNSCSQGVCIYDIQL